MKALIRSYIKRELHQYLRCAPVALCCDGQLVQQSMRHKLRHQPFYSTHSSPITRGTLSDFAHSPSGATKGFTQLFFFHALFVQLLFPETYK